jgi:hypothetical protein
MFSRPTEAGEPLAPVRASDHLIALHVEWSRLHAAEASGTLRARVKRAARQSTHRLLGRADDDLLLGDLVRAVDALAARCDELAARLAQQEAITADVAAILGEDITRLTADVSRMRSQGGPEASQTDE